MIARAVSVLFVVATLFGGACMETRRSLGEDCLKDDDCLSGICSQLRCATTPRTIDAPVLADATAGDALGDATRTMADASPVPDGDAAEGDIPEAAADETVGEGDGPSTDAPWDTSGSGD